jgi:hypothetical protein
MIADWIGLIRNPPSSFMANFLSSSFSIPGKIVRKFSISFGVCLLLPKRPFYSAPHIQLIVVAQLVDPAILGTSPPTPRAN